MEKEKNTDYINPINLVNVTYAQTGKRKSLFRTWKNHIEHFN